MSDVQVASEEEDGDREGEPDTNEILQANGKNLDAEKKRDSRQLDLGVFSKEVDQ